MKTVPQLQPKSLVLLCILFLGVFVLASEDSGKRVRLQTPAKEHYELPYVLIIGDSIAQSYLPRVKELLADKANIYFVRTPQTAFDGQAFMQACFKQREWDLVHLNYGLDPMRYEDAAGHLANAPAGKQAVSQLEYSRNLSGMLNFFLQRKTKRIWATTTPIPEGVTGYVAGEGKQRNAQYKTLIGSRLFFTNDLYNYVDIRRTDLMQPNSVEMTETGARLLGEVVAGRILEVLNEGGDKRLPYVLLLGDSISNGYNVAVRERLMGKANVLWGGSVFGKNPDMAKLIENKIINREKQIGRKIDVVHINWGLHAMKYVDENNRLKTPETGQRCVPLEEYREDLETFMNEFKKTNSKLIWASTTPVNGSTWAKDGDSIAYNSVALGIMKRYDIVINDLYGYVKKNKLHKKYGDCHFNAESSAKLAIPITDSILHVLQAQ